MSNKEEILIISDTDERDGLGMEVWQNDKLVLEIFRDDKLKKRTITFYEKEIELGKMEEYIARFKIENLWDFTDPLPDF
ncbi:hypothetical protein [Gramella sp. MAR_2010_147]|uniref:hypothetical protein n=1 Tax=Gramella sp. MAR_2010_147 TaxID=1250205 RepID=UPI000B7D13C5|nr:hypothetical protein [Gramella sp. MAR_2010_147]